MRTTFRWILLIPWTIITWTLGFFFGGLIQVVIDEIGPHAPRITGGDIDLCIAFFMAAAIGTSVVLSYAPRWKYTISLIPAALLLGICMLPICVWDPSSEGSQHAFFVMWEELNDSLYIVPGYFVSVVLYFFRQKYKEDCIREKYASALREHAQLHNMLPVSVTCTNCDTDLKLNEEERRQFKFTCPTCSIIVDLTYVKNREVSEVSEHPGLEAGGIQQEDVPYVVSSKAMNRSRCISPHQMNQKDADEVTPAAFKLKNCPHCATKGVLPMPGSICPNCKKPM